MSGLDELPRKRAADSVAPPSGRHVEATHAKGAGDVGALRTSADPDDFVPGDGDQDRFAATEESFAPVFPSLEDGGDDPNAFKFRMVGERRDRVGEERGGRHDLEHLGHVGGRYDPSGGPAGPIEPIQSLRREATLGRRPRSIAVVSELRACSDVVRHRLRSEAVDDDFEVSLVTCGHEPRATLVVTDADGLFGLALDTVRLLQIPGLVPAMTVVGVGYPGATSILDTVERRNRDLTPTSSPAFPGSGGGEAFAAFLRHELFPWLEHRSALADDRIYFGHSLGGLFGTWILLTRPTSFDRYILSSPSLWWDENHIFDVEASMTEPAVATSTVQAVFGIGSLETDAGRRLEARHLPPDDPFKPPAAHLDMVDDMRRFVERLDARRHHGLDVHSVELANEFHATVPGIVLSRALRHLYDD